MRRLKILTWHTHGSYLYYLSQVPHDLYVLSRPGRPAGYAGRHGHMPWGPNVIDMPVSEAARQQFDCIIFQDDPQYLVDQYEFLTEAQRQLPRIYLEHDPPRQSPTEERHPVHDHNMLIVHVTHFNRLMWNCDNVPVAVIEHGVLLPPEITWTGELSRGIVVVNNMASRGRRLGGDIFETVRQLVPLDLVGMNAGLMGGQGEILHGDLPRFLSRYRFFFNPIRYTSLGLALIEAMMIGVPVVALATTEVASIIRNGHEGFISTRVDELVDQMHAMVADPVMAARIGEAGRDMARERFHINRFVDDWNQLLTRVVG